jgi:1,4-alpha-glucan branching enzyme
MQNIEGTGVWQTLVPLKKGRYEYKFYVDGEWVNDPNNPDRIANDLGENSTIEID